MAFMMGALVLETLLRISDLHCQSDGVRKSCRKFSQLRPIVYRGQNIVNLASDRIAIAIGISALFLSGIEAIPLPDLLPAVPALRHAADRSPIGGADMPTVIALLNSYAGLSACADGVRARQ